MRVVMEKKHFVIFNDKECMPAVGHAKAAMNLFILIPVALVSSLISSTHAWPAKKIQSLFSGDTDLFFRKKHVVKSIDLWIIS